MSEKHIITAQEEPDDFIRYLRNMKTPVAFSAHLLETGTAYIWVGKEISKPRVLIKKLENFISELEKLPY